MTKATRDLSASHLADVKAKIADLRAMERTLKEAVRRCNSGEVPGCPLIDVLSASADPQAEIHHAHPTRKPVRVCHVNRRRELRHDHGPTGGEGISRAGGGSRSRAIGEPDLAQHVLKTGRHRLARHSGNGLAAHLPISGVCAVPPTVAMPPPTHPLTALAANRTQNYLTPFYRNGFRLPPHLENDLTTWTQRPPLLLFPQMVFDH